MRETRLLAVLAVAGATVYAFWLTLPYPLLSLYQTAQLDLGNLTERSPAAAAWFVAAAAAAFAVYGAALALAGRIERRAAEAQRGAQWIVLGGGALFAFLLLWAQPVGAVDVYDYIFRGRMAVLHGLNPLLVAPDQIAADPWFPYVAWVTYPSPYGPLWASLSAALNALAGQDLLMNLLVFKAAAIIALLAVAVFVASMQRAHGRALSGALFVAWNPLVLYEVAVNAHNDIVMLLLIVLSLWLAGRRRWTAMWICAALAAQIKIAAAALVPALALIVLMDTANPWRAWRRAARMLLAGTLVYSLILAATYAPWWAGEATLDSIWLLQGRFTSSAATVLLLSLEAIGYPGDAGSVARLCAAAAGAWAIGAGMVDAWKRRAGAADTVLAVFWPLVALATLWFQPWYALWLVVLAGAAAPERRLSAALCAAGALAVYPLFDFAWFWFPLALNAGNTLAINAAAVGLWLVLPLTASRLYARRRRADLPQSGS